MGHNINSKLLDTFEIVFFKKRRILKLNFVIKKKKNMQFKFFINFYPWKMGGVLLKSMQFLNYFLNKKNYSFNYFKVIPNIKLQYNTSLMHVQQSIIEIRKLVHEN